MGGFLFEIDDLFYFKLHCQHVNKNKMEGSYFRNHILKYYNLFYFKICCQNSSKDKLEGS